MAPMISRCRVILVEPSVAGNVGASARIMYNMGLTDLRLVRPKVDPLEPRARRRATRGESILKNARQVDELGDAIADCSLVAATSAKTGGLFRRQTVGPPSEVLPQLTKVMRGGARTAVVFGPERTGLTNPEITRCHYLIRIPTGAEYPALNLSQAVAICLYELRRCVAESKEAKQPSSDFATLASQEHMFTQLQNALEEIHFLYGEKAESLMHALRHLLGRANLTDMEVKILLGLARQIRWYVNQHPGQS